MKRMRILYVITRSELGGAQTHLVDLIGGFKQHFDQLVVAGRFDSIAAERDGRADYLTGTLREMAVPFHTADHLVQPISPWADLRALSEITTIIRETKPDLIHANTS